MSLLSHIVAFGVGVLICKFWKQILNKISEMQENGRKNAERDAKAGVKKDE